jgi:heptosyltransferase-2
MATLALFVSNDSGLMHVAAALRIPQVAIIGPTDPAVTGPSNPNSRLVQAPVPCSPCKHRKRCPTDHQCMTAITLAQVYRAALAAFTTAGAGTIR